MWNLEVYDRSVISYMFRFRNGNKLIVKIFGTAIETKPNARLIFHSSPGFLHIDPLLHIT